MLTISRDEQAFAALPASNVTPRATTAEAYDAFLRHEEADRLGSIRRLASVEHIVVGQRPHAGHAVRFTMADGTTQYFAPHTA